MRNFRFHSPVVERKYIVAYCKWKKLDRPIPQDGETIELHYFFKDWTKWSYKTYIVTNTKEHKNPRIYVDMYKPGNRTDKKDHEYFVEVVGTTPKRRLMRDGRWYSGGSKNRRRPSWGDGKRGARSGVNTVHGEYSSTG